MNYSEYPEDWKDVIRPSILKRDNYKCSDCNIKHRSRVYKASRGQYIICDEFTEAWAAEHGKKVFTLFLNVAHLDQDKSNNDPSNLLSKCPRCHSRFDAPFKKMKRLLLLNSKPKSIGSTYQKELELKNKKLAGIKSLIKSETNVNVSKHLLIEVYELVLKSD